MQNRINIEGEFMDKFSKQDTAVVKGVAALMLVCHHFFMGILPAPIDWANNELWVVAATLSKVCVAIFVILSGYGISESHKRWKGSDIAFTKKNLLKLMKQYWFIFVIFVPLGFVCNWKPTDVYGTGFAGFGYFLIDFFGMKSLFNTPTMNQTWWYMEACIVLYLLYPLLSRLMKRLYIVVFALSAIPVIKFGLFNDGSIDGCREIYWILPFAAGIFLSQKDLLNKMSSALRRYRVPGVAVTLFFAVVMTGVRSRYGIIADTFYAIAIIAFSKAALSNIRYVNSLLGYIGNHSANIFMMHSFIYCYFAPLKEMFMVLGSKLANFSLLMVICLAVSDYIEILKKRLSSLFEKQVRPVADAEIKKEAVLK